MRHVCGGRTVASKRISYKRLARWWAQCEEEDSDEVWKTLTYEERITVWIAIRMGTPEYPDIDAHRCDVAIAALHQGIAERDRQEK